MLIVHRAIRSVSHWGSVFSSPRAAPCMSSIPWIPTAMQRLYFLWKYSPAPLATAFRTHEIPEQPGQPEKALDHVTVWKSLGRQQEITHTLAEVDLITKQAIWTAWLMVGSQASGKGAHVSPSGQGSHGDAGQGTHTHRESISWDPHSIHPAPLHIPLSCTNSSSTGHKRGEILLHQLQSGHGTEKGVTLRQIITGTKKRAEELLQWGCHVISVTGMPFKAADSWCCSQSWAQVSVSELRNTLLFSKYLWHSPLSLSLVDRNKWENNLSAGHRYGTEKAKAQNCEEDRQGRERTQAKEAPVY